jgi:hypothetical protein
MKGSNGRGAVKKINEDPLMVVWTGGQPLFIEVEMDDGTTQYVHPKLLKTKAR